MNSEFAGQTGIVTGAAQGLGRAVSTLFGQRGGSVIMVDMNRDGLNETVSALKDSGIDAHGVVIDLGNEDELPALQTVLDKVSGGRLDLLVNNVGGWRHARFGEISMSDWDWTFRTNLTAPFLTTRAVLDRMIATGDGRIVNVASTDAHRAKVTLPHYAAAKSALVSLTRSLAEELAPQGILVNAVSPGAIATETAKRQDWFAERIKSIPVGRAGEPEDIAEVILFLGSKRNRYVVGQTVMANGGLFMN